MKWSVLVTLILALALSGCAHRAPTLDNPDDTVFTVAVLSVDPAAKTALVRYSDDSTAAADITHFTKLKAKTMAFADVGFKQVAGGKNPEPDMAHPLIVWYPNADRDGYTYDPDLMVHDGIRDPSDGIYWNHKRIF